MMKRIIFAAVALVLAATFALISSKPKRPTALAFQPADTEHATVAKETKSVIDRLPPADTERITAIEPSGGATEATDWKPWTFDDQALRNHLISLNPHPLDSVAANEWFERKYSGFPIEELVRPYRLIGSIGFEEVDIYIALRDSVQDYNSWAGEPGAKPPIEEGVRGDFGKYVSRYTSKMLPNGQLEHRWYSFPPDEYPDVASRAAEANWLHNNVHAAAGNCPICFSE